MRLAVLLLSVFLASALAGYTIPTSHTRCGITSRSTLNNRNMAAYRDTFNSYFPLRLYATTEDWWNAPFSCITWGAIDASESSTMTYYKDQNEITMGTSSDITMKEDRISITWIIKERYCMGARWAKQEMTFYLVDDTGDFLTFKACVSGKDRTYTFLKSGADKTKHEWRCVIDALNNRFDISSVPKGICAA